MSIVPLNLKKALNEINAARELRNFAPLLKQDADGLNPEELLQLINSDKWRRFFWIKQVNSEILALCKLIERKKPRFLLEIGTANGGSLFLFSRLAHPEATIISVDLPGGQFGGGYPSYRRDFYKSFANSTQKIFLLRANSHDENTLEQVKDILGVHSLDFLFIDGDHTYQGVKTDFDLYASLVKKNGIIALHDIAHHPTDWGVEVDTFWSEIKQYYSFQEFIENPEQGWAGIGIIEQK